MFIFVTNKNDFTHVDRFDGNDYVFDPQSKQMLSEEAAAHMFGYGRKDRSENLVRLGWANRVNDEGVKWLAKFIFTEARVVEAEGDPTVNEEGETMPIQRKMGRPPMQRGV